MAMVVIAVMTVVVLLYVRLVLKEPAACELSAPSRVYAAFVYSFLYIPIVVVVVLAFNSGRQVLNWEGFSTSGSARRSATRPSPSRSATAWWSPSAPRDRVRRRDRPRAGLSRSRAGARCRWTPSYT